MDATEGLKVKDFFRIVINAENWPVLLSSSTHFTTNILFKYISKAVSKLAEMSGTQSSKIFLKTWTVFLTPDNENRVNELLSQQFLWITDFFEVWLEIILLLFNKATTLVCQTCQVHTRAKKDHPVNSSSYLRILIIIHSKVKGERLGANNYILTKVLNSQTQMGVLLSITQEYTNKKFRHIVM